MSIRAHLHVIALQILQMSERADTDICLNSLTTRDENS